MTQPTQHAETHNTANGADQVTTATLAVSGGDLISIACQTADGAQSPSVRVHNTAGTLITEDETIAAATDGLKVYRETVTSFTRTTTGSAINGATTVACTSAAATDVGLRITDGGTHLPAGTVVVSVSAGVSLTMSNAVTGGTMASGTVLTLSSDIAADYTLGDGTNGKVWFWSVQIDPSSTSITTISIQLNWGPIAGARRYRIKTETPAASTSWPTRSTRTIATYGISGGAGFTGDKTITRQTGTTITQPCVANLCSRSGSSSASTITFDWDGDGSKETTTSAGNGAGRVLQATTPVCVWIDGYWDASTDPHPVPGSGPVYNTTSSPGTAKVIAGVVYGITVPPAPVNGTQVVEHDTPRAGTSNSGPRIGGIASEGDHPRPGTSEVGVQIFGSAAHEADVARQSPALVSIQGEWLIGQPLTNNYTARQLKANVSKVALDNPADIKIGLRVGSTTINESAWTALTDTPTALVVPITNPITNPTDLRLHVEVRKLSDNSIRPVVNTAELDVSYFTVGHDTPHAGTTNAPPVRGTATSEHDKAAAGAANAPAVAGRATSEHDHPVHGQSTTPVQGKATSERDQVAHGILGGKIGVEHDHPVAGHVLGGNPQGNSRIEHDTPHAGTVAGSPIHGSATVEHDTANAAAVADITVKIGKQTDGWQISIDHPGWIFT